MIGRNGVGDGLQQHGFAGARRGDDKAALAFAHRSEQVHDAAADSLAHGLHLDAFLGIKRRQVVEEDLVARLLGRLEVDGFDLDQREVLFSLVRGTDVAADRVAGLEIELANLRRRDVDVVRAGEIVVVRRAQEAVAVGKNLQHAFGEDVAFFFALRLEDLEDQILLAKAAGSRNLQSARNTAQFGYVLFFQFSDGHDHLQGGMCVEGCGRGEVLQMERDGKYENTAGRKPCRKASSELMEYRSAGETAVHEWNAVSRLVLLLGQYGLNDAVRLRGDVQPAGPQAPQQAPAYQGWRSENGTELHWWCLAAVYSACAAYELPC